MKKEDVSVRYGVSDVVLNQEENKNFNCYIELECDVLSDVSFYFDEEEDGEDDDGNPEVWNRYAGTDTIMSLIDSEKLTSKYVKAKDGQVVDDVELYFVAYEDEDGNELDRDEVEAL